MNDPQLRALGPLRHVCNSCGTCCEGWKVSMVDRAERDRIIAAAKTLGIEQPIVDGSLRQVGGRCVFLTPERLCAIHAELGADQKPKVCQQFPRRATLTEDGYRVGLDPACTSTWRSWLDGPEVDPLPAMQEQRKLARDVAASEHGLIRLAGASNASVSFFVGHFLGDPRHVPELPPTFATRACTVLSEADLEAVHGLHGPDVAARIAHLVPRMNALDPTRPPKWAGALRADHDAFALEVIRRQLFLRLGDAAVPPFAQVLLLLLGVFAAAWSEPHDGGPPRFPATLSSWSRLVRTPRVWQALLPDLKRARWLATGSE